MAAEVPTNEPETLTVGDSWTWKRNLEDYDPSTWTLTYRLIPQTGTAISFSGSDDDGEHLIDVPAATTAAYTSGEYLMIGSVSDGTDRFEIFRRNITVYPNPTAGAYDYRTFWEKVRDDCQDALMDASGRKEVSYTINGRSHTMRSHAEILSLLSHAQSMVANEQSGGRNRKILARFL
jgi:hypothetical protein